MITQNLEKLSKIPRIDFRPNKYVDILILHTRNENLVQE